MGTSPRMRLNFRVFFSSFIFSAGSRLSVSGMERMGCSSLRWEGTSGLCGAENLSREGERGDLWCNLCRGLLPSLDGRPDEDLVKGILRLSEKLFLLGFDRSMAGAWRRQRAQRWWCER